MACVVYRQFLFLIVQSEERLFPKRSYHEKKLFSNRKRLPPNNYKFHSIDTLEARELNPKVKIFLNIPFLFAVPRRNILKLACVS